MAAALRPPPFQSTLFVGRDSELAEIARRLREPGCRLMTLLGPGGIGKTRLALEVAARHAADFRDGVAFVALAGIGAPSQIASSVADALGLTDIGNAGSITGLLDVLRTRHMLLVLDNYEHVVAHVDLVAAVLAHAPRVTLLITSRERLNMQAEWLFDVDGLAYPYDVPAHLTGQRRMEDLADFSAIQLFVQRARQLRPTFPLSDASLAAVARICRQLAGMPLAIELAAASLHTLSLAEVERQIATSLVSLATTYRDVPARHQSMRAVFDHSWELLSEPERASFSRLAVFRGRWTLEAAERVTGATATALAALVNRSLVRQVRVATAAQREQRFSMLEPIRAYALEHLKARGELEIVQRAHAIYYLALADSATQWDTAVSESAVQQLDLEHDNLRAALQWARDAGDRSIGLQLAAALRQLWRRRGELGEGHAWLEALLAEDHDD